MDKKSFKRYAEIKEEILEISRVINGLIDFEKENVVVDKVKGSDNEFPYIERSFTVIGTEKSVKTKIDKQLAVLNEELKKKKEELSLLEMELKVFIITIPDRTVRMALTEMMNGKSQAQVARDMYMTASALSKRISKFLK